MQLLLNFSIIAQFANRREQPVLISGPTLSYLSVLEEDRLFIAMVVLAGLATVALTAVVMFSF